MTYLPSESINSNFKYTANNDYFRIYTNNNCYTQYSSTYCDCYYIYPKLDYIKSEVTSCNVSNLTNTINYNNFTDDFYYRIDFVNILLMFFIMSIFIIYIPLKLFSKIFRKGVL